MSLDDNTMEARIRNRPFGHAICASEKRLFITMALFYWPWLI
jgi:hypothetical protein